MTLAGWGGECEFPIPTSKEWNQSSPKKSVPSAASAGGFLVSLFVA
jgi:hypothetical protein